MGELFAGPGYRTCSHPGCRWPAVTTLGYDYSSAVAWLEELDPAPHPAAFELCSVHADRFKPPKGWSLEDRRESPAPLFAQSSPADGSDAHGPAPGGEVDEAPAPSPERAEVLDQVALPEI